MGSERQRVRGLIEAARARLGIEHLVLTVHDASFPSRDSEDIGRGSPYSHGAADLLEFAADLGFNGLQLGPQGKTNDHDPSPYNGSLFARSHQSLDVAALRSDPSTGGLVAENVLEQMVEQRPPGARELAAHGHVFRVLSRFADEAYRTFRRDAKWFPELSESFQEFCHHERGWLESDGVYEALSEMHGSDYFPHWDPSGRYTELDRRLYRPGAGKQHAARDRLATLRHTASSVLDRNAFTQFLLERQHRTLRDTAERVGMRLWADMHIGCSARDLWRWGDVFLKGYSCGAPPSRTNPDGQAWGFPVLDPAQIFVQRPGRAPRHGPAAQWLRARVSHLLDDFDGLRIDHPHGLVCPWVYRSDHPDPARAVREGARLRSSPSSAAHRELGRFAIAQTSDLAPGSEQPLPYADAWVRTLSEAQVGRYAALMEIIVAQMKEHHREPHDLATEVLSTCPYPLARVLERYGLGRFRVVQKANPDDLRDPYRSQTASERDWIMLGTHDTPPIWRVAADFRDPALVQGWSRYLALRLAPDDAERPALEARLASDRDALVHALFADLFVGPARHVSLFFPDLFGMRDVYNKPGTTGEANWRLRVPADFATRYEARRAAGQALDLPAALGTALRARTRGAPGDDADLARALLAFAASRAVLT
jgi:4-alpha-glucanotransferase